MENPDSTLPEKDELYEHRIIIVDKGQEPIRVDKFLLSKIENISRNKIQNGIDAGNVMVNNKQVKSNYKVKPSDRVTIVFSTQPVEHFLTAEAIPLTILYEDDDLAIVNKPAGMVVHPGVGNYTGTLVNGLLFHFLEESKTREYTVNIKERKKLGNHQLDVRPFLVHRIDKNTSGILVVAKNDLSMEFLANQFFHHTIKRKYIALVWGDLKEDTGTITGHIGRSLKNRQVFDVFEEGEYGKHAVTHYKVLERIGYVTLIECELETGRTHQIRVHMSHIGHPVFSDEVYGGNKIVKGTIFTKYKQFVENCFEMCPRQALHARSLGFIHPTTRKAVYFEADLPADMSNVIDKWRKYIVGLK